MNDPRMQAALARIAQTATPEYLQLLTRMGYVPPATPVAPVAPPVVAPVAPAWTTALQDRLGGWRERMGDWGDDMQDWGQTLRDRPQAWRGSLPEAPRLTPVRPLRTNLNEDALFNYFGRRR